ncbi:Integrator complex subunit 11 [Rhizophlyctis rosea]|nr:Integrator complex subunit 11 [Rhizophlyctis rosea]
MGYSDHRRFPDFTYISKSNNYTSLLDCIIISHFHLDHCGALPYFTELLGYSGPIFMTYPTKAIAPILLEDMRKVAVERKGEKDFFTSTNIKNCMKKVIPLNLHETYKVDDELEIKPYYAGHVLGAAMFHIRVGNQSVVYTGDYNMTPDRHLGAAWIDKCRPTLLITETTYASTIRDSKRARERDFLSKIHSTVLAGGKVLIPVFALGRAQELCILIESYWERLDLDIPIYFSAGLTERANEYYKLFLNWTNEKIRKTFVERNMFEFAKIRPFEPRFADNPGPCVLFASPGMLHAGTSLEVFKKWCTSPLNTVILPGYCVAGTVGAKILAGEKIIDVDRFTKLTVNCSVENLSFSAHADAKGIMQLIRMCEPENVMLVHGERGKMEFLRGRVEREVGVRCFMPANGCSVDIVGSGGEEVVVSKSVVGEAWERGRGEVVRECMKGFGGDVDVKNLKPVTSTAMEGVVVWTPPGERTGLESVGIAERRSLVVGGRGRTVMISREEAQLAGVDAYIANTNPPETIFKYRKPYTVPGILSACQTKGFGEAFNRVVTEVGGMGPLAASLKGGDAGAVAQAFNPVVVGLVGKVVKGLGWDGVVVERAKGGAVVVRFGGVDDLWEGGGKGKAFAGMKRGVELIGDVPPVSGIVVSWAEGDQQLADRVVEVVGQILG